jgi:two-component system OmpR family sensor kinase/two-component system sensor histidine kinase QseC
MNSIRTRLLLALLAMLAVVAMVMGAITYRNVLTETEALFDYQLRQMALSLRDQGEIAPDQAGALADEQFDFVVQIWTVDGRSIYASRDHNALPARALLGFADVRVEGQTWRAFSVATPSRVIQVAQPRQIRQRLAANAALHSVLPLLFLTPLMGLTAWWLVALNLSPLRRVASQLRERGEQLLEPLPAQGLPDEVSPLVSALNGLLNQLGQALDNQRAFVSDAAHELRSPLTALKLQLETFKRAADEGERMQATTALATGIERAVRIVEQLLVLARSEPGAAPAAMESADLSELVRQALVDTAPYALSRGSEFELQADGPVMVQTDKASLPLLVRNLADNAVRYSPPGSRVELRVFSDAGVPTLQVDDAGPGIPEAERVRVFDRFYRRAADGEEGTGLGLAIVRSVAERHGAQVRLGSSPSGGLRVTVRFGG